MIYILLPQHLLTEVHGSWYDPSNPVVKAKGVIRQAAA